MNATGSFVLGLLAAGLTRPRGPRARRCARLLLGVGFCGGYTTFSTFSLDTMALLETRGRDRRGGERRGQRVGGTYRRRRGHVDRPRRDGADSREGDEDADRAPLRARARVPAGDAARDGSRSRRGRDDDRDAATVARARARAPGCSGGFGHTTTILLVGGAIVALKLQLTQIAATRPVARARGGGDAHRARSAHARGRRPAGVGEHGAADHDRIVHGLAGSAAVATLPQGVALIPDPWWAVGYLAVFGVWARSPG